MTAPTPEQIEECMANRYESYLSEQSDYGLVVIFHNAMCKLMDNDCKVREFDGRKELIKMITELDFTGKLDVGGFER